MNFLTNLKLSTRSRVPELMDQPGLDEEEHVAALRGLSRINVVSGGDAIYWPEIARPAKKRSNAPLRLLDLASGGGDVTIRLAKRSARAGLNLKVEGCDVSPVAVEYANRRAKEQGVDARFFEWDALGGPLPEGYDIIVSSLFMHHLDEESAVDLLRRMAAAARSLVLVNDLTRGKVAYLLAWIGCRLLSGSRVVRHDGPVSVRAAFTPEELASLASRAGLNGATLARRWPRRVLLTWRRE